ncbi:3-isopropylmalate dehydratase large subunit [Paraburkholderia phytofirmans]|jgi:3-isopropylmalate/(R)-2-methylmalate dehydratase large subunit|uniref:3-isopropylmalate dehydratase large subunit n=1 Tax=Paraburkholderia sp. BL9I2N2 TaxID=1938809 RepID=UPI00104AFC53|nr:3-isopropylmalate dehydratase large subunit [Paraburkholderia sp. BL9I2N2]
MQGKTLFEKIWSSHEVVRDDTGQSLLYIDRNLIHEGSRNPFQVLAAKNLTVRRPDRTFATPDHYAPTTGRTLDDVDGPERRDMVASLTRNAQREGITLFGMDDPRHGITHVVGPEQGLSLPGMTIVCGDSHTSTHGALGALAFGVGASDVALVLATQSVWQRMPLTLRVTIDGELGRGVSAKDVALALIAKIGASGATGHVIEYTGSTIAAMSMEGRLTLCNLSIEAGARAGIIAPDETTFAYIKGRPFAPAGEDWNDRLAQWRMLFSDPDAAFDTEVSLDATRIAPMVTWGNSVEDALPISGAVPDPASAGEPERRAVIERTLDYMGLRAGEPLDGVKIDYAFIGSCTNGRIEDLRSAAAIVKGKTIAAHVTALVVPGSAQVKLAAQAEGLDRIFVAAGFQWREPGCSMCLATNGDTVPPGARCASTSNRNFVGRQGPESRTHLMSPAMAAAAAIAGHLTDVRQFL